MLCALGICLALLERAHSGKGQVVDAAMVDGAAYLGTFVYKFRNAGMWRDERGTNMLDGAAPFYDTYRTKDGEFMSVGAIEPQFYAALLKGLGLDAAPMPHQMDQSRGRRPRERFAEIFATKTRAEWCADLRRHRRVRGAGARSGRGARASAQPRAWPAHSPTAQGKLEPAPAPRLSRTPGDGSRPLPGVGEHTEARSWRSTDSPPARSSGCWAPA